MHACPYASCTFKALQKGNLQTHIGKHTGDLSHRCPECPFATNYQANLITHRKGFHGYQPTARRYLSGRAAQMSAADLVPCDAAESSHSGNAEILDEFGEVTWEKLFPPEIYGGAFPIPTPTPNSFDAGLLSDDDNSQQPVPAFDADIEWKPASGNDLNNSIPAGLEEFLLTYGSGSS
jgi:hypothetical protein